MSLFVDIEKDLGSFHLKVSFETEGSVTGLLGASGCGKSMTLRCIAGIEKPDRGRIVLNGETLFDSEKRINLTPQKRKVGYLFQNYALFPNMTVEQNILCGLCREKNQKAKKEKAREIMRKMMLTGLEHHKPHQLSGGQQQRCALARILVNEPEVLLLDEPFSALDTFLRVQLQTEMKRSLNAYGRAVLLVTHDRDEAYHLCRHLMIMDGGHLIRRGSVKEVFRSPGNRQAAKLTGCKNVVAAEKISEYEVYVPSWGIRLQCREALRDDLTAIGIRAHYFNDKTQANRYPVILEEDIEEPFEWICKFRYVDADPGGELIWWRFTKEKKLTSFPKELGIAPQNVMPLYVDSILKT